MFERFTDRARRVLVLAQEEARLLNHNFIGTEHLLLGLLQEGDGVAARVLAELEISLEAVLDKVEAIVGTAGTAHGGSPPFTPRAKKVLELSLREALQLDHNYIGTEHILLGLLREGEGVGAQVLMILAGDLVRVRQAVMEILSGYSESGETGTRPSTETSPRRWASGVGGRRAGIVGCSFCDRRPPETGQLVAGSNAFICEHCIRHWASAVPTTSARLEMLRTAEENVGEVQELVSGDEDGDGDGAADGDGAPAPDG
jgi:Clp amino terminal domain, pathogenicity island component/ClpX C4-type zinc finger